MYSSKFEHLKEYLLWQLRASSVHLFTLQVTFLDAVKTTGTYPV